MEGGQDQAGLPWSKDELIGLFKHVLDYLRVENGYCEPCKVLKHLKTKNWDIVVLKGIMDGLQTENPRSGTAVPKKFKRILRILKEDTQCLNEDFVSLTKNEREKLIELYESMTSDSATCIGGTCLSVLSKQPKDADKDNKAFLDKIVDMIKCQLDGCPDIEIVPEGLSIHVEGASLDVALLFAVAFLEPEHRNVQDLASKADEIEAVLFKDLHVFGEPVDVFRKCWTVFTKFDNAKTDLYEMIGDEKISAQILAAIFKLFAIISYAYTEIKHATVEEIATNLGNMFRCRNEKQKFNMDLKYKARRICEVFVPSMFKLIAPSPASKIIEIPFYKKIEKHQPQIVIGKIPYETVTILSVAEYVHLHFSNDGENGNEETKFLISRELVPENAEGSFKNFIRADDLVKEFTKWAIIQYLEKDLSDAPKLVVVYLGEFGIVLVSTGTVTNMDTQQLTKTFSNCIQLKELYEMVDTADRLLWRWTEAYFVNDCTEFLLSVQQTNLKNKRMCGKISKKGFERHMLGAFFEYHLIWRMVYIDGPDKINEQWERLKQYRCQHLFSEDDFKKLHRLLLTPELDMCKLTPGLAEIVKEDYPEYFPSSD